MQAVKQSLITELYLTVHDNEFDKMKSDILLNNLRQSGVKNFVFSNTADAFNAVDSNFSDFDDYMKPIKQAMAFSNISWQQKVVI